MNCYKCLEKINEEGKYGLHMSCFLEWFHLEQDESFKDLELKSKTDPSKNYKSWNSSFFHGNYKKYAANLGGASYILKVKEVEYPDLPEVEYTCNKIARYLKIPVPDFFLISLFGESVFVTKNFCRTISTRMTLDHIYKYLKEDSGFDCETLMEVIFEQTKKYLDISIFVQTCLFDALIGNHDRHGKNLGLIVTSKSVRLAPIYDNPSQLGLESGNFLKMHWNPKGKIFTKDSTEPTPKNYVKEFIRLGHEDAVFEFIDRLNKKDIFKIISEGFYSNLMKGALTKLTKERMEEFHENDPRK